jgi:hypothetical protein
VGERAGALEFAEDLALVRKEIADEAVGVLLL